MKPYTVHYRMSMASDVEKKVIVMARTRYDAWLKASFEDIPKAEHGEHAYYVYVHAVTYNNGNYRIFSMGGDYR